MRAFLMALLALGLFTTSPMLYADDHDDHEHKEEEWDEDDEEGREWDEDDEDGGEWDDDEWEDELDVDWESVVALISKHRPALIGLLKQIENTHPEWAEEAEEAMYEAYWWLSEEGAGPGAQAMLAEMEFEIRVELAAEGMDDKTPEQRQAMAGELRNLLEQLFEAKVARREAEIHILQAEINEIRTGLERARNNRERIIEARLRDMIGDGDGIDFEW